MAEHPAPQENSPSDGDHPSGSELAQLREILIGAERRQLDALRERVDTLGFTAERLADELPEAIFRRSARDRQLSIAMAPTIEGAIGESVRKHPAEFATAIFPVLGPAIRKAIAEALSGLVTSVNTSIGHSMSLRGLRWRFEAWRTGVPFAQVVIRHSLLYRVEQMFLIHADTGLLLAHASSPDLTATDGDLISGMLTAIRDFVGDSFAQERDVGGLKSFNVGELSVRVEPGPRAVLAAVVRGPAPDALQVKLQETIETIHHRFAGPLEAFQGDATPFEPARELLADCIETVLASDVNRGGTRRRAWLPWAIAAVVLIALVSALLWRRSQAWKRAIAQLENAPGIVLVRGEHGLRRWQLTGLRDPMAERPAALLAAAGADTTLIDGRWQPYVSLDSAIVIERSRRQLSVPASVVLSLDRDTMRAVGDAPLAWLAHLEALDLFPPGVSRVDLTGVTPRLPAELSEALAAVERRRVLFDVASFRLTRSAMSVIDTTATALLAIDAALRPLGRRVEVSLEGRADPTGMDSTNRALSGRRADAVREALARRGIPVAQLTTLALGTARPVSQDTARIRANVNRSVSFTQRLVRSELSATQRQ